MTIYVLWRAPRMQRSVGFAGISTCFAWWSATLVLAHDPNVPRETARMAYDIGAVAWASFASFCLWFGLAFTGRRALLSARWLQAALVVPPVVVMIAQWRGAVAADYELQSWGWAYVWSASPWTLFFYAYYAAAISLAIGVVFLAWRSSREPLARRQAAIIVFTAMVPFVCSTTTDVVLPWLGIRSVPNIAPAFLLPWTAGIAWAIVRYRLLDISPETAADDILKAMTDGIVLVDREDRAVSWNPAATQLVAPGSELRRAHLGDLLAARARGGVPAADGDLELDAPSGARTVALTRSEVRDPAGALVGAIYLFRDVTDRDRAARALREAHDQLEERVAARTGELATAYADRQRLAEAVAQSERLASVGVLAAGVAHEINNPLTYVSLGLYEIQEALEGSGDRTAMLARAREAIDGVERISKIVRELGTFAKHGDEVRVHVIAEPIEAAVAMSAHARRDRLTLAVDNTSQRTIRADPGRLAQLFLNLLVDSAGAVPSGHPPRPVRLAARDTDEHVIVEITDAARRIPAAELPRLFEMFGRGAGPSGLALAICHKIARAAGGQITVTSTEETGTTFTVQLPRSDVTPTVRPTPLPAPLKKPVAEQARLLIVDDDQLVGKALRRILAEHRTTVALSGVEARGLLEPGAEGADYDLILCDLMMPDSTGVELHAWLREHRPELARRIVFMTGGTFTPEAERFVDELRSITVLAKPFDVAVVERVVRDELAKRRA